MESNISESKEKNPLNESEEMRKKAREELNLQLQGLLNNQPIENPTEENIEDEVNRLMEEVDIFEKNYVPKDLDENEINELNKFEEEFGDDDVEDSDENEIDEDEIKEKNIIKNNINNKDKINDDKNKKNKIGQIKKKRSKFDMDLDLKNLEDIVKEDYNIKDKNKNNKKEGNIAEDKEIKDLLNEYDKLLDKELEQEVEKEFKPKLDIKDIKRADLLLKVDPLINEALVQGRIKKDELVLFIDYYEIFSLSNKAKKFTSQQLQKIDDLCYKKNNDEKNKENNDENNNEKNKKKEKYDLNDENAIDKLTSEIEKGLQDSEEILMKKLDYEKCKMEMNKKLNKNKKEEKNDNKKSLNKNNNSSNSSKTIKTNYTLNNNSNQNNQKINNDDNRPVSSISEISCFTQEELNSVPRYSLPGTKKEKSIKDKKKLNEKNNLNISTDKTNKTFYQNNINNNNKDNIINQNQKPKTPFNQINKASSKRNSASSNSSSFSSSIPSGKKTIPPLKKSKNFINLKSNAGQNIDLFDDNANPINMSKFRGTRKELVKLKMGGKSKVHELFINKPRNLEENEKIKQKFMEFIKEGKDNKKNQDINGNKKSTARKKIEDAKNFNKSNK